MPNARLNLAALAALIGFAGAAPAQVFTPRTEYERLVERPKTIPQIPTEMSEMVRAASPDRLFVRGLDGQEIAVDIEWYEPSDYRLLQDGRFIGMSLQGYEDYGYYLIDRAATGQNAVMDTGQAPVFSDDGRFIAAAELTDAGWSNLEGIAVWEVLPNRTVRRFFTNAVPFSFDWRVDSWVRPDCVAVSAIGVDWQPPEGEEWERAVPNAPRNHYGITVGSEIAMIAAFDRPVCSTGDDP